MKDSKKMKQLDLSKFFSGVKSPIVKKLNVPYKETIIPNPVRFFLFFFQALTQGS